MTTANETDMEFMRQALLLAHAAADLDEVPVGAVIVHHGEVIAAAHNENRGSRNPVRHAEICAIEQAASFLENERLTGCVMYVTKEPCAMCSGAIVHARIEKVYIGARDIKYGACGTVLSVCGNSVLNHVPLIEFGLLEGDCAGILREFFRMKREAGAGA